MRDFWGRNLFDSDSGLSRSRISDDADERGLLLFVCTANVARSPYAELVARTLLADAGLDKRWRVLSAGIPGTSGRAMDVPMGEIACEYGVCAEWVQSHRSQPLSPILVRDADLIITMTIRQRDAVLDEYPGIYTRVMTVGQLENICGISADKRQQMSLKDLASGVNRLPANVADDVEDPFGAPREVAQQVGQRIDAAVGLLMQLMH